MWGKAGLRAGSIGLQGIRSGASRTAVSAAKAAPKFTGAIQLSKVPITRGLTTTANSMGEEFQAEKESQALKLFLSALLISSGAASFYFSAKMLNQTSTKKFELSESAKKIIEETKKALGEKITILTGKDIEKFTTGFRGKKGSAVAAVEPESLMDLYKLISCYQRMGVGYLLQGANTALKGQGTPNYDGNPVVIIRTCRLKKMQILDIPGNSEYKVLLVKPGLSLKEAEGPLSKMGFDLPHKIGSHDMLNTFGASAANGCGGTRVDNADGRASKTESGKMGTVSISADGTIYNGIIEPSCVKSGEELLTKLDGGKIPFDDIEPPDLNQIPEFMRSLFTPEDYPITNHRGNIFAGDGGEGSQAIAYQMYVVRKKPKAVKTFVLTLKDKHLKSRLYQEAIFSAGSENPDKLPIYCEHMGSQLVSEIVQNGVSFSPVPVLAMAPKWFSWHFPTMYRLRGKAMAFAPSAYIAAESFAGRLLSRTFTPTPLRKTNFEELVIIQAADRDSTPENIKVLECQLKLFAAKHSDSVNVIELKPGSLQERIVLQTRNIAALATLTLSKRDRGTLFAFDDAVLPGDMMNQYREKLTEKLLEKFPDIVLKLYSYGHDLKKINHNDWVMLFRESQKHLSPEEIREIYHIQFETMHECGGVPHAEHGVGDHADTDLNREGLVELVAHRLINDPKGIANPGGGFEKAYQKALKDPSIVREGIQYAQKAIKDETNRGTLLSHDGKLTFDELSAQLFHNVNYCLGEKVATANSALFYPTSNSKVCEMFAGMFKPAQQKGDTQEEESSQHAPPRASTG